LRSVRRGREGGREGWREGRRGRRNISDRHEPELSRSIGGFTAFAIGKAKEEGREGGREGCFQIKRIP